MRTLLDLFLETGDEKFLQPIPAFIASLKRSEIVPDKWARYYELKRPAGEEALNWLSHPPATPAA